MLSRPWRRLVRQDKCSADDVKEALVTFGELDIDGSGELDQNDVQAWIELRKEEEEAALKVEKESMLG